MKMSCCNEIEDDFFDATEVFLSMSDSIFEHSSDDCSTYGFKYDSWIGNLDSVNEHHNKFIKSIGLSSKWLVKDEETDATSDETKSKLESAGEQNPDLEDAFLIRQPSLSYWSNPVNENLDLTTKREELDESFNFGPSSSSLNSSRKETLKSSLLDRRKKVKKGWLQKLNIVSQLIDHQENEEN
ncbi:hypothetical protein L1887_30929 [Cichorium endivia]|nr:hypothetical protein L1887_30929 [Cichorium endivia]